MTTTTETSTEAETTAAREAANLHAIASWIEAHPDVPPTHIEWQYGRPVVKWLLFSSGTDDEQLDEARRIRRAIGGTWRKGGIVDLFELARVEPDSGVYCRITVSRTAACVRKVVGHEDVTIPAVQAQPERIEHREVVEWDCQPILDAAAEAVSA
jgi:hypothetical protein